jgi:beta-lactamase superfamily II metal-dependent hydrolase
MDIDTFSIGKADCSLLSFDGCHVLIDTGETDDGNDIIRKLKERQVEKLDLVILTHFDKDHIGGFGEVAAAFPIEKVILPDYERESEYYENMIAALRDGAIPVERLSNDISFDLGRASFTIWTSTKTYNPDKGNDNQMSLVTAITFGQIRLLFMADAEGAWMKDLCYGGYELGCNIIKFPCHGKWQKNVSALLGLSLPQYAIVTDSEKNPADAKTMDALNTLGVKALCTSNGDVHLFTDGITVKNS